MDKVLSKALMIQSGIPCPPGIVFNKGADTDIDQVGFPCVVKPSTAEDSMGITLVASRKELAKALASAFQLSNQVLVEQFIQGRELRCCVLEEIDPSGNLELIPLMPQEFPVDSNGMRTLADKYELGPDGLPLGETNALD